MATRALSGEGDRKKQVLARTPMSEELSALIAALGKIEGVDVLDDEQAPADLVVIEADRPEQVQAVTRDSGTKLLAVSPRRLRSAEIQALMAAGADVAIDPEHTTLELAFAMSDLLFTTFAERRRYERAFGGAKVKFVHTRRRETVQVTGKMLGITRSGITIQCTQRPDEGSRIELELELLGRKVPIRGRVAFASDEGFVLEYALDDQDVAPKLEWLLSPRKKAANGNGNGNGSTRSRERASSNGSRS